MKWIQKVASGVFLFALLVLLASCSSSAPKEESLSTNDDAGNFAVAPEYAADGKEVAKTEESQISFSERKVIYNATLSLEVEDYGKAVQSIQERVNQVGGYVVNSSSNKVGDNSMSGYITVRVPQPHFQTFLEDVETEGIEVNERYVEGNDVTEEYIDLESRLRAKQEVEKRLLEFMDKAENTESLLKISNDLAAVQEQIEQIIGRMKYLDNHVDYSTVTVHLHAKIMSVSPIQSDQLHTWTKSKSLFMSTINGLMSFFSGLIIGLIGLSPVLIPITLIAGGTIVFVKKRKKKQVEPPTNQE